jgi:hypothetical protein
MARNPDLAPAALGFRVKSGWAMAALVSGSASAPKLLHCQSVLLSDPKIPESKQPYHAALDRAEKEAAAITARLRKVVRSAAEESVASLLNQAADTGCIVRGTALVVGSLAEPASLHNEHIRAHALEGQLFRMVLEEAFRLRGIPCSVLLEKTAYATAAAALAKSVAEAKSVAAALGNSRDGAWRAEEKLAALAAWTALVRKPRAAPG